MSTAAHISTAQLEQAELRESVRCRRCGYDLRGLRLAGACPECGFSIMETVISVVDPAASRLPRLRDPRGVGDGLVWLVTCLTASTLLWLARPLALRIDQFSDGTGESISAWTPPALGWIAGLVALLGLWSVLKLAPPKDQEPPGPVWRDLRALALGLVIWGAAAIFISLFDPGFGAEMPGPQLRHAVAHSGAHLAGVTAAIIILLGLRGVLRVIGERSREYRSARGGRQRIRDMLVAACGLGAGQILRLIAVLIHADALYTLGTVIMGICSLMLVIGLCYLLVNAWWIRRSLRRPPPTLRALLEGSEAAPEAPEAGEEGVASPR